MGQLTRYSNNRRSLLRQVNGQPSDQRGQSTSGENVNVENPTTPFNDLEDYDHSPDVSDDEGPFEVPEGPDNAVTSSAALPLSSTRPPRRGPSRTSPQHSKEARSGQKRKSDGSAAVQDEARHVEQETNSDPLFDLFSMSQKASQSRYRSSSYRSNPTTNIHGSQNKKTSSGDSKSSKFKRPAQADFSDRATKKKGFIPPQAPLVETNANKKGSLRQPSYQALKGEEDSPPASPGEKPGFIFPASSQASPLSTPPPSDQLIEPETLDSSAPVPLPESGSFDTIACCPMCDEIVDRELLVTFRAGQKLRWKDKMDFCTAHKQQAAAEKWTCNKYPTIKWHMLERRLRKFHKQLTAIIEGRQTSFYRNRLEEKVDLGKNRNALKNPELVDSETVVPGYYGRKGARLMMDHLMAAFSTKIRKIAASDKLIPQIGVSIFIQAVLVPELAVMLVKEDLKVDDEQARIVLVESAEVGDLLNAEEEERLNNEEKKDVALHNVEHIVID